ncbi:hypothetical protein [Allorhizocola rhizosphaerae]|uniref:hypothetical protein n=1 Tax=Allorhizocola rhizosphaerae TaxID=1872709 RepID=UPI000E3BC66D|nr:hypothetical protein [Allorhizocola rhizosphaerae]
MKLRYRVEIRGILPGGLANELRRRFGEFTHYTENGRTVLTNLDLDQAALRALLDQLWDVHSELRLVTTIDDEITLEHR